MPVRGGAFPDGDRGTADATALYRWWNDKVGDHFYTTDPSGELAPQSGYSYVGITGYVLITP
jgi:Repeat of unknown function (DUF5648)